MLQIPTFFIHPALLVERYSNSVWNSEVSWSVNTFEDHGRWKFFAIGGDCECDCKAPLLGAARLHWNCSADTEFKGSARRKLESHRSIIHIEQPGERMAIPIKPFPFHSRFSSSTRQVGQHGTSNLPENHLTPDYIV